MKQKVLCSAIVAISLSTASMFAHADGEAFVSLSAGRAQNDIHAHNQSFDGPTNFDGYDHVHIDKKDVALGITGGYRWTVDDVFAIGPEVGYVDLGSFKGRATVSVPGEFDETFHSEIENKAILLGINAKWKLGHNWSITARTGLFHTRTRIRTDWTDVEYYLGTVDTVSGGTRQSSSDTGVYGAVQVGYDFTAHFGVAVAYEHYDSEYDTRTYNTPKVTATQKIGVWAVSAQLRF